MPKGRPPVLLGYFAACLAHQNREITIAKSGIKIPQTVLNNRLGPG